MTPITCKEAMRSVVLAHLHARLTIPHRALSQDYGFAYSDGSDDNEVESADAENMYYTAKCMSQLVSSVGGAD